MIDSDLDSIISFHRLISNSLSLNGHLIYFDPNFSPYFERLINHSNIDHVTIIKINNEINGFIHLKILDDTVFLNNIYLNNRNQGQGLGKFFLKRSLDLLPENNSKYFALDVFMSNKNVISWYQRLGLQIIQKSTWNFVYGNNNNNGVMEIGKDGNGFNSVFVENKKVATIVNNDKLLVHDLSLLDDIQLNNFQSIVTNRNISEIDKKYNFVFIDTSARMKGLLNEAFEKLNNDINA